MKVTVDTNLLIRIVTDDDPLQAREAMDYLDAADVIVVPIVVLCELIWVLRLGKWSTDDMARVVRGLLDDPRVAADRDLTDRGLAMLDAGGDFADGVIAEDGARLGAETFVTFDRKAARLLEAAGSPVTLLG